MENHSEPNAGEFKYLISLGNTSGWSHRRFFPKRNQNPVPPVDPVTSDPKRQHLSGAAESAPESLG